MSAPQSSEEQSDDLRKSVAAVLRKHQIGYQRCSCGWFTEHGVVWDSVSAHLAERVAEALDLKDPDDPTVRWCSYCDGTGIVP